MGLASTLGLVCMSGQAGQELRALHVDCADGPRSCAAVTGPDAPGTGFTMRHGRVVQIYIAHT